MLATLAEAAAATGTATGSTPRSRTASSCSPPAPRRRPLAAVVAAPTAALAHLAYAADYAALVDAFTRLAEATGRGPLDRRGRRRRPTRCSTCSGTRGRRRVHDRRRRRGSSSPARRTCSTTPRRRPTAWPRSRSSGSAALTGDRALPAPRRADPAPRRIARRPPPARRSPTSSAPSTSIERHHRDRRRRRPTGPRRRGAAARYLPNAVLAWGEPYESPLWESRNVGFAYVCRDYACLAPVDTVEALVAQLSSSGDIDS